MHFVGTATTTTTTTTATTNNATTTSTTTTTATTTLTTRTAVSRAFTIGLYPAPSFNDQSKAFFCKPHFASYHV